MTNAHTAFTDAPFDADASDAELISRVRGGDVDAYGTLFERHRDAANRLARQLVPGPDADDLVAEAFVKVLNVLMAGGGPDVALRAYLLTAVRRLHIDKIRATKRATPTDDLTPYDPGVPFSDTVVAGFEGGAAAQAFASLPERWQLVLWHLEVEGEKPADVAPLLGMTPNSVSALAYRAREGLRQAFLQMHTADIVDTDCTWTHAKLGAYVRKGLSRRDNGKVEHHLDGCRKCTAIFLELNEINSGLAALLGPIVLGSAAVPYLAATSGVVKGGLLIGLLVTAKDKLSNPATAAVAVLALLLVGAGGVALVNVGEDAPPAASPGAGSGSGSGGGGAGSGGGSGDAGGGDSPPPAAPSSAPPGAPVSSTGPTAASAPTAAPSPSASETVDDVAPSRPTNLRVITTTTRAGGPGFRGMAEAVTGFRATWDRSTDDQRVAGYEIFVDGKRVASVRRTAYTFSRLEKGKRYAVYVVARDEAGNKSARSNTVRFSTEPMATPTPPANHAPSPVSFVDFTDIDHDSLTVTWGRSVDPDGDKVTYTVRLSDGQVFTGVPGTSQQVENLTPDTAYTATVAASDGAMQSAPRSASTTTTEEPAPRQTLSWDFQKEGRGQNPGKLLFTTAGASPDHPIEVEIALPPLGSFTGWPADCQATLNLATCSFTTNGTHPPLSTTGVNEDDPIVVTRVLDGLVIPETDAQ